MYVLGRVNHVPWAVMHRYALTLKFEQVNHPVDSDVSFVRRVYFLFPPSYRYLRRSFCFSLPSRNSDPGRQRELFSSLPITVRGLTFTFEKRTQLASFFNLRRLFQRHARQLLQLIV